MEGKYRGKARFHLVRAQRWVLRRIIRGLVSWRPMQDPEAGYTVLIGCSSALAELALTNLAMLSRQGRDNLNRIVLVFDRPKADVGTPVEDRARSAFPELPLEFVYYTPWQARVMGAIGWGWTYAWLSWCLGIARTKTRYAFLQDLDAFLLQPDLIELRYEEMQRARVEYLGSRWYGGNGVIVEDGLVGTPELMFDARFVRDRFAPIDLFNHVCVHNGRTVDFDTFLYPQTVAGRRDVVPVSEQAMVHPSQLICQFTAQSNERNYVPPAGNNLLLIPYFTFVAGSEAPLRRQTELLDGARGQSVPFAGRTMDLTNLHRPHADWIRKQALRLEQAIAGHPREEVVRYFDAVDAFVRRKDGCGGGATEPDYAGATAEGAR